MMSITTLEACALEKIERYSKEAALASVLARPSLRVRLARALYAVAVRLDTDTTYRYHPQVS